MKTPVETPRSTADHTPPPPRRGGRRPLVMAFVAALAGAILALGGGILYLRANPLASGATVTPAPVIKGSANTGGIDAATIYKADAPGIVLVKSQVSQRVATPFGPQQQRGTALGSGFVVDGQGRILTNYHVVEGASGTTVTLYDKRTYDARLVGSDPSSDLAILKINAPASELKPLPLGDSSSLKVGQPVVAIGNPLGYNGTETEGIVSALERDIQAPNGFTISGAIQTDTPLTNGNSGGPLIDANGRVVGINSQVAIDQTGTTQANGIGFAVPINTARDAIQQLDQTGRITHPYLGISGYGITPDMTNLFPTDEGVAVADVVPGGPADRAGIKGGDHRANVGGSRFVVGGDVITAVDGRPVKDMGELQSRISNDRVGQQITLKIVRGSGTISVPVTLGNRPQNAPNG